MATNRIGLDSEQAQSLADKLNTLLANYQIFYMNTRGFHWNIKGEQFFELHVKFEEQYADLLTKVDEIAERILTLGHQPLHAFSDYLSRSEIEEAKGITEGRACVEKLVDGYRRLLLQQRELMVLADEYGDEGTNSLMSDYIGQQEKTVWMLSAWLG